jgi:hypothetical protein
MPITNDSSKDTIFTDAVSVGQDKKILSNCGHHLPDCSPSSRMSIVRRTSSQRFAAILLVFSGILAYVWFIDHFFVPYAGGRIRQVI